MTTRACMNTHIVFSGLTALLILLQTMCGKFTWDDGMTHHLSESFYVSWFWFLDCFLPLFVYLYKQGGRSGGKKVDGMAFLTTLAYGFVFFGALFGQPFSRSTQGDYLLTTLFWMIPFQAFTWFMIWASVKRYES